MDSTVFLIPSVISSYLNAGIFLIVVCIAGLAIYGVHCHRTYPTRCRTSVLSRVQAQASIKASRGC